MIPRDGMQRKFYKIIYLTKYFTCGFLNNPAVQNITNIGTVGTLYYRYR